MLASRPGLGLNAIQDHFVEVLVLRYLVLVFERLVLVLNGGLGHMLRLDNYVDTFKCNTC